MENALAMQIVGVVLTLVAVMKNKDPVGFNKDLFGDVEGVESLVRIQARVAHSPCLGLTLKITFFES